MAAVFLLVVVAALAAFAVRTTLSQRSIADLDWLNAQAQAALDAGVQAAALRLQTRNCTSLSAPFVVDGMTVRYGACVRQVPTHTVGPVPVDIFTVPVTVSRGVYGRPEFVSRTTIVRIAV